eukprot:3939439-Rhodomonas_salina.1
MVNRAPQLRSSDGGTHESRPKPRYLRENSYGKVRRGDQAAKRSGDKSLAQTLWVGAKHPETNQV